MSASREKKRLPNSRAREMILAVEDFAREAHWSTGKCSIAVCCGQVVKIKISCCMTFDLKPAQQLAGKQYDDHDSICGSVSRVSTQLDLDSCAKRLKRILTAHLADCRVQFGAIRFQLKDGAVRRVTVAFSHVNSELDRLDHRLFGH